MTGITADQLPGIVSAIILAYKEGKNGEAYHPGYTPHEAVAFEIGQRERAVIAGIGLPRGHEFRTRHREHKSRERR